MGNYAWTAFEVVIGDGTFSTNPIEDWAARGRKGKVIGQDDHRALVRLLNKAKVQLTFGQANESGLSGLIEAPMTKGAFTYLNAVCVQPIQHRRKFEYQAAKRAYIDAVVDKVESTPSIAKRVFC